MSEPDRSPSVLNRKARFRYHIEESLEAGLVLLGSEVKAIREGKANLTDAFVRIKKGEAFLIGAYSAAPSEAHEPVRERKLLLHRRELDRLAGKARERGYTLVVTKLYFKDGRVKAELSLGRGKQAHDKRRALRERSQREEVARAMRRRR